MPDATSTIKFFDEEANDDACVVVRKADSLVGLCVSLKSNGDVEVFPNKDDSEKLIQALRDAVSAG